MKSRLRKYLVVLLVLAISFTSIPCFPAAYLKAGTEDSDTTFEGEAFKAEFILLNSDNGNYQAKIKIINKKDRYLQNWTLRMEFNSNIETIEQASIVKHDSNVYYIKGLNCNRNIAPNDSIEFMISGTSSFVTSPLHYSMIEYQDFVNEMDYMISYQLENSWDSGYQGKIVITNKRETPIQGWNLEFDFDGEITQAFVSVISSHEGNHYTMLNSGYNENINPGETLEVGFLGTGCCLNTPTGYILWERANYENEPTLEPTPVPVLSKEPTIKPTTEPEPTNSEQVTESPVISPSPTKEVPSIIPTFSSEEPSPSPIKDIPEEYEESVLCPLLIYQGKTDEEIDINADYDGDGLSNLSEYEDGTDPGIVDSDGDGLDDYKEIYTYNTDPLVYDTDNDGLGDGTEVLNGTDPCNKDSDGDGLLDGEERVENQILTNESYSALDCNNLGVTPSITVTGKGDYSSQIRLENESYNGLYDDLDYLVSPVIHIEHREDMIYESATVSFTIGKELLQSHELSNLSIVRLEDGSVIPIKSTVDEKNKTVTAQVDKLCEYAVEDKEEREGTKGITKDNKQYELVYVIDTTVQKNMCIEDLNIMLQEAIRYMPEYEEQFGFTFRLNLITYRKDISDIRNYGRQDSFEQLLDAAITARKYSIADVEYPNQDKYKAEALNEAYKMFSNSNAKKLIVLFNAQGNFTNLGANEPLFDGFINKCRRNGNVSLWQHRMYYDKEKTYRSNYLYTIYKATFTVCEEGVEELEAHSLEYHRLISQNGSMYLYPHSGGFYIFFNGYMKLKLYMGEKEVKSQLVRLSNYQYVRVSLDPTVDSDGDGIPDQSELAEQIGTCYDSKGKEIPVYAYRSNPDSADTDGDGFSDDKDPYPKDYDVTVASYDDSGIVRLNTGKAFKVLFSKQYPVERFLNEYYRRTLSLNKVGLEMTYSDLRSAILMNFSMDELECISLIDEGMMRFLVGNKGILYQCQIFEHLTGKMVCDVQTGKTQLGPLEGNYNFVMKDDVLSYFSLITYKEAWTSYYQAMFEQILLGRFSKSENTGLGLIGEIGVAFTGLDAAQDIRDLLYDATHWECSWEHVVDTALNAVSILPIVGAVGHADEVVMFIKRTDNLFEIRRVAKIGEDIIDTVKHTTNSLENFVNSADLAIRRMGQNSYSCLLEALDNVKQGGKMQLCTEYGTDFSKAFAEFGDDAENLAYTHPSAVQKAYRETIEECTNSSGKVTDTVEKIEETGRKNLKAAEKMARHADEELSAIARKYSDDVMSYKFVGEKYVAISDSNFISNFDKYNRQSEKMYESYRSSIDDIKKIAENTNWDISDIQQVKAHLFLNELRLDNKVALLDPDIEIALAWSRLIKGEYYDCDILLLKHELYESTYYKLYDCNQREAHNFTCKLFDWGAKIELLKG